MDWGEKHSPEQNDSVHLNLHEIIDSKVEMQW